MSTELARQYTQDDIPSTQVAGAIAGALEGLRAIRTFIDQEFQKGTDFGTIPGCGDKPTLFLPGAQKATMYFNAFPTYKTREVDLGNGHVEFRLRCLLISRSTGQQIGEGIGCCSTMEKKYRWRGNAIVCPKCGKPAIFKSKEKPEFYCWRKKEGCGAIFGLKDPAITSQGNGTPVENPEIYDVRNTVLKMAKKRAHVDAAMTLGCLSELFTQDIEDTFPMVEVREAARPQVEYIDGQPVIDGEIVEPVSAPRRKIDGLFTKEHIARTREFEEWVKKKCETFNAKWHQEWERRAEKWMGEGLDVPSKIPDLLNPFQARGHLLKWAQEARRIDPDIIPEDLKPAQSGAVLATVYFDEEHGKAMVAELRIYGNRRAQMEADAIYRKHPELAPEGWAQEQKEVADRGDAYEEPEAALTGGA